MYKADRLSEEEAAAVAARSEASSDIKELPAESKEELKKLACYENLVRYTSGTAFSIKASDGRIECFASRLDRSFIYFFVTNNDLPHLPVQRGHKRSNDYGWKIHVAVDSERVAGAWDIVKNILIDEAITSSKVVVPGVIFDTRENGKQITIYQFKNPRLTSSDWQRILQTIENALTDALSHEIIGTTSFCECDRPFPGSLFLAYRNDCGRNMYGRECYISELEALNPAYAGYNYNPGLFPDPFESIDLEICHGHGEAAAAVHAVESPEFVLGGIRGVAASASPAPAPESEEAANPQ